jgi:hypothetical protein
MGFGPSGLRVGQNQRSLTPRHSHESKTQTFSLALRARHASFRDQNEQTGNCVGCGLVGRRWHTGDHRENFDEMAHYPVKIVKIQKVPWQRVAKRSASISFFNIRSGPSYSMDLLTQTVRREARWAN